MLCRVQSLNDKRALITGASAGIGAAVARDLAREGCRLVLAARRQERLEALARECTQLGAPEAEVVVLDVRDAPAVSAALAERDFDIVLNNAGLARGTEALHEGQPEEWAEVVETNVTGVLYVLGATLPRMVARGSGDYVFLGSVAGYQVYPGGAVYCATKHAVRALYEGARIDARGCGVRLCAIHPAMVETEFSVVRFRGDEDKAGTLYDGMQPLSAQDVSSSVLFALKQPAHVNVGEVMLWPTDQASTTLVHRRSSS